MSPIEPISLRPAGPEDEPFLFRVFASTRIDELAITGWDEAQKLAFLRMQFHAQSVDYRGKFRSWYDVIVVGDVDAGRLLVEHAEDEVRIADVGLLPEYRNRGIGGGLMRGVLDEAARAGLPVRLHVEQFNPALRLYQRLGFTTVDEHGIYLLMEWSPATGRG